MPKLNDLGLSQEQVGQQLDYASMPDQMGGFTEPPQPGAFRFRFPPRLDDIWEKFEHTNGNPPGVRLRAKFGSASPLTIIQSPQGKYNGDPFETSVTNAERRRGKREDTTAPWICDMDYINRDVWGLRGKPTGGNVGYAQEFMKHANSEFSADIEWSWYCNDRKNVWVDNGQGGTTEVEGKLGCGTNYYQKDVQKVLSDPMDLNSPPVFPLRIQCQCGAMVRAFANLVRFRA